MRRVSDRRAETYRAKGQVSKTAPVHGEGTSARLRRGAHHVRGIRGRGLLAPDGGSVREHETGLRVRPRTTHPDRAG